LKKTLNLKQPLSKNLGPNGAIILAGLVETFEKRSSLFKAKEGENFNHRNTLKYLRIKI